MSCSVTFTWNQGEKAVHVSILSLFFRNKELHRRTAALAAGWLSALYSVNGCQWQPAIHHLVTLQMKAEVLTLKSFASAPDVIAYQMTSNCRASHTSDAAKGVEVAQCWRGRAPAAWPGLVISCSFRHLFGRAAMLGMAPTCTRDMLNIDISRHLE